jgi:hypothetical protein
MSPSAAEELISQVARTRPQVLELAELLAPAVRAEGVLVRRLRLELLPHLSAEEEAGLWFSPLVQAHSAAGLSLSVPVAVALRQRLARQWQTERRSVLERARTIYAQVHASLPPPLLLEEEVAWLLVAGDADGVSARLASALAAVLAEPDRFRFWAAQAAARLPDGVRMTGTGVLLTQATTEDDFTGGVWEAAYRTLGTKPVAVRHTGAQIEFGGPVGPGSRKIDVPDAAAVPLELRWSSAGVPAVERVTLDPSDGAAPIRVDVSGHVDVRTAAGIVYLVRDDPFERPARIDPAADLSGELQSMLVSGGVPGLRLAEGDEPGEIGVELRNDRVTLVDSAGQVVPAVPQPGLREEGLAARVAALAAHVSRWLTIAELRSGSPVLAGAIELTVGTEPERETGPRGREVGVAPGEPVIATITNLSDEALFAAILALASDWSVEVLTDAISSPLNSGDQLTGSVQAGALGPGQADGSVRVVAVAARYPFNSRRLRLPGIGQAGLDQFRPAPTNPYAATPALDDEFAFMTGVRAIDSRPRYLDWTTSEATVHVYPPPARPDQAPPAADAGSAAAAPAAALITRGSKSRSSAQQPVRKLLRIGLLGASASGKTTFLAALYIAVNRSPADVIIFGANDESTDFMVQNTSALTADRQFPTATALTGSYSWIMNMTTQVQVSQRAWLIGRRKVTMDVPLQIHLDMLDPPGEIYSGHISALRSSEETLDMLASCDGFLLFVDPIRERAAGGTYEYLHNILLTLADRRLRRLPPGSRLPQHVAVCITKFDDPDVYNFARLNGYRTYDENDPYLFPRVHDDDAKSFFLEFCRGSEISDGDLVVSALDRHFYPERTRYFMTSAIGFYLDRRSSRFRDDDPGNVAVQDGIPRIRGRIHPINVLEPISWLGQRIESAPYQA